MNQVIDNKSVYVVDFTTLPELPIIGLTEEEAVYETLVSRARGYIHPSFDPNYPKVGRHAAALQSAIETGIITGPGKYGIHLIPGTSKYEIYTITE